MFGNETHVIKVEGMMCEHCAAHVKDALEKVEGVKSASVNLEAKEVTLKVKGGLNEEEIRKAVEGVGKKYVGLAR